MEPPGCCEVILTGIETGSYGRDMENMNLETLLELVDSVPGIRRIALGSLDPTVLRPSFLGRASALSHLLPHFHLSVQSGCTEILHRAAKIYCRKGLGKHDLCQRKNSGPYLQC